MRYLLPIILYLGLTAFVIADIAQHRDQEPYRLPKTLWVLIALFAPYVGALAWLIARWSNPSQPPRAGGYRPPNPDDDPAFKVWLNEQERRRKGGGDKG